MFLIHELCFLDNCIKYVLEPGVFKPDFQKWSTLIESVYRRTEFEFNTQRNLVAYCFVVECKCP